MLLKTKTTISPTNDGETPSLDVYEACRRLCWRRNV